MKQKAINKFVLFSFQISLQGMSTSVRIKLLVNAQNKRTSNPENLAVYSPSSVNAEVGESSNYWLIWAA